MEPKNLVMSKSSNTAMASKAIDNKVSSADRKSKSSARFRGVHSKKRGMYVQKKSVICEVAAPQSTSAVPTAQRRSRKNQKLFMYSCLSILSKDTTATQFPECDTLGPHKSRRITRKTTFATAEKATQDLDVDDTETTQFPEPNTQEPNKAKINRKVIKIVHNGTQDLDINDTPSKAKLPIPKTKKLKFRSRALKQNFNDNIDADNQPTAYRAFSSINYASINKTVTEDQKFSQKYVPQNRTILKKEELKPPAVSTHQNAIESAILEINNCSQALKINKDPPEDSASQLVDLRALDKTNKCDQEFKGAKSPGSTKSKETEILYNLIVDLLKSAESDVHNIVPSADSKFGKNDPSPDSKRPPSSKGRNETIAEKTKMEPVVTEKHYFHNKAQNNRDVSPPKRLYFKPDDDEAGREEVYQHRPNCCRWNSPATIPRKPPFVKSYRHYRTNLKSQSFREAQRLKIRALAKKELSERKRKASRLRKSKEPDLLSIIKKELSQDYKYPKDLHTALAILRKKQNRTRRAIRSDDESNWGGIANCFERRKIISATTKKTPKRKQPKLTFMDSLKSNKMPRKFSLSVFPNHPIVNYTTVTKKKNIVDTSREASYHSIEVEAYDYEANEVAEQSPDSLIHVTVSKDSMGSGSSKDYVYFLDKGETLSSEVTIATNSTPLSQIFDAWAASDDLF